MSRDASIISQSEPVLPATAASSGRAAPARELLRLTKPGITRLVTVASGVGFAVAASWHGRTDAGLVLGALGCIAGTAVASAGANGLNQAIEVERDRLMDRTAGRPLPAGRLGARSAWTFAVVCSITGPLVLLLSTNWVAASLALATIVLYAGLYTPLKTVSPLSTYVGAIPGALPCLIGWAAASPMPIDDLGRWPAWTVFGILLVWQIPHFLAIVMMYREQYERAGFRPVSRSAEPSGIAAWVLIWSGLTVVVSAAPLATMPEMLGTIYAAVAAVAGAAFVYAGVRVAQAPTRPNARRVFFASIAYLPVVYLAMVADALLWNGP